MKTYDDGLLPCCGYADTSAVMWNEFNKAVQCHNCGQIYSAIRAEAEQQPSQGMVEVPREPTWEMIMALCGEPVILAASHEQAAREAYAAMLRAAQEAK